MIINNFTPNEAIFQNKVIGNTEKSTSFENVFKEALDKVNDKQITSDSITQEFIEGGDVEIHEVMLATEEAKMSLQLAVQIRNKVVEAAKELMQMQL